MPTRSSRPFLLGETSKSQNANMNSDILQKLEVMSHLLTIEHIQIKHQLEIDARLAEFEQNREQTPTSQPILNNAHQSFGNEKKI